MRLNVLLAACAVAAVAPAAAIAAPVDAPASRDASDDGDRQICRRVIATGTVMPRRVCHTKAEWDALAAQGQSDARRAADQDRSRSMVGPSR